MKRVLFVLACLLGVSWPAAAARQYSAERFDVRVEVQPGGSMQVTETIVFRFSGDAFTYVFREIPRRRTDGWRVVRVAMDGVEVPEGKGAGTYEMTGDSKNRVRWNFAPIRDSRHTFELTYLLRGVVTQEAQGDQLWFQPLPTEHAYRVDRAQIDVLLPVGPSAPVELEWRRADGATAGTDGTRVTIDATGLRKNGWVAFTIRMPSGSVIAAPPEWQQRQARARAAAPKWLIASGAVLVLGAILLFALRQGYDAPPPDLGTASSAPALPDSLDAPLAGALVANGSVRLEHAMAALFRLADRGDVQIDEQPRARFGQRQFLVRRTPGARPVRPYEETLLNVIFTGRHGTEDSVELGKARNRAMRKLSQFRSAVVAELTAEGLLDDDRTRVIRRYRIGALVLMIGAGASVLPLIPFFDDYAAWPLVIPAAIFLLGVVSVVASATLTPLSNEGVRRRRQWTLYRTYLNDAARDRVALEDSPARLLPFAVATGVAVAWSKYLKQHRVEVPPWFRPADGASHGFVHLVAAGGSGAGHGAGGAGGSGAAGGGASGAG